MTWKRTTLAGLTLAIGLLATGCGEHRHGRVYDPYYSDYHQWGPDEDVYYHRWYGETYHDRGYRDYRRLNRDEQHKYWTWRHEHHDDHDRH